MPSLEVVLGGSVMADEIAVAAGVSPPGDPSAHVDHQDDVEPGEQVPARRRDPMLVAGLALLLVPLLVSAVTLVTEVGDGFIPIGDYAQMELRVRDVGRHTPLVGLWSRADWNHPGPMGFFVLAPVYRLIGSPSIGLNLAALVVNGVALSGIALLARQRGGTPLMLCTALVSGLMVTNLGADFVRSPWNPYLPVLSYGLLILLAWSMACGEIWALPVTAGVVSFAAQTHVGFLAYGLPLVAWGLGALVWRVRRDRSGEERRTSRALIRWGLLTLSVVVVLWLPPLLDLLTRHPTNAEAIIRFFTDPSQTTHSLADGWRVMAAQFSLEAEWLTGRQSPSTMELGETSFVRSSPLPLLLVPLAGAGAVLWRGGRTADRALVTTLLVAFLAGLVAISRTLGPVLDYRLQPTWWVGALAGVMGLWVLWRAAAARWPTLERRWLVPLGTIVLAVLAGVNSVSAVRADILHTADSEMLATVVPEVVDEVGGVGGVGDDRGEVLVTEGASFWTFYAEAMVLQLERQGIDATVPSGPFAELRYGRHRVHQEDDPVRATLVVAYDDSIDRWARNPGYRPVAEWSEDDDPIGTTEQPIANRVVVFVKR